MLHPILAIGKGWWLPTDYSEHGWAIDSLFTWIFWITMVTFIGVQALLVIFLVKYRHKPEKKKAHFTHGNTKLEMAWTIAPALVLAILALASKGVWDNYRYSPIAKDPDRAKILVIGQQFKWNVVYPGPDGKFGKYLIFPKPTDVYWPLSKTGAPVKFKGVTGPAALPYDKAVAAINEYIDKENPLGKVFNDPDGIDDDWDKTPGREINIPVNRPVEVQLGSKDVIHDFFLPNFRVKLDAVPGMRGEVYFTATKTSAAREAETRRTYNDLTQLAADLALPENKELAVYIDEQTPGMNYDQRNKRYRYVDAKNATIVGNGQSLTVDRIEKLKAAGITQVSVYQPGYFDVVCEELCGQGHYTMQAKLVVLDNDKYAEKYEGKKPAPTTAPSADASSEQPVAMGPAAN